MRRTGAATRSCLNDPLTRSRRACEPCSRDEAERQWQGNGRVAELGGDGTQVVGIIGRAQGRCSGLGLLMKRSAAPGDGEPAISGAERDEALEAVKKKGTIISIPFSVSFRSDTTDEDLAYVK